MKPVTAFLQFRETDWLCKTADSLRKSKVVESLVIVGKEDPLRYRLLLRYPLSEIRFDSFNCCCQTNG